jgi:hypothetical protein
VAMDESALLPTIFQPSLLSRKLLPTSAPEGGTMVIVPSYDEVFASVTL